MDHGLDHPALTFGIAMAIGMAAQVAARHMRLPGIVLLLAAGVIAGPDVLDIVRPDALGGGVQMIVGIAVAVILFEGGLSLDVRRLRAEALVIRRLVTAGAVVTAVGATLAAHWLMGWDWRLATLFGTLVIVTGPTVVTPLVRRLRVKHPVSTILEAEGLLIDPIGAIIAVVALELLYAEAAASALARPAVVLGGGALMGAAAGAAIAMILRRPRLVPDGLENVLVLSLVIGLFQVSEAILAESGLTAVVAAGLVVGNIRTRVGDTLLEFKEQLTALLIGLLFVLLAADVRIDDVRAIGWPAIGTVAALMLLVRPAQAFICAIGTNLSWRERTFIASLAPRGIVAAAVASLFAETLTQRGLEGGTELRALVFLVIAITVTVHGVTGGLIARLLGLRRPTENGWVILGANSLAFTLGRLLRAEHPEIVFIDSNPQSVSAARNEGFLALYGQGLLTEVLQSVDLDSRIGCIALTPNEEVNVLWASKVRAETRAPRVYVAMRADARSLPVENAHEAGAVVLFGAGQAPDVWAGRIDRGEVEIERWRPDMEAADDDEARHWPEPNGPLLLLTVRRAARVRPVDDETVFRERDEVDVAIHVEQRADAEAWLVSRGWKQVQPAGAAVG
jgi:NhaP-type Na+/H+ or K+/H+ antiporter